MPDNMGASATQTGLAGAEAPEPHSGLGSSSGIPSAGDLSRYDIIARHIAKGMTRFMQSELMRRPCRSYAEPRNHCLPCRQQSAQALIRRELLLPSDQRLYRVTLLGRAVRRKIAEMYPFDYHQPEEY
jgi:hypothetical protein